VKPELLRTIDVFLEGAKKPLMVILGPTAAGKTSLSIEVARHVDGEVVNADSRQLYCHLDIGTAKVTEAEMQGVPHHLIDVCDPKEEITVGWYQEEATKVIEDILTRGKVPLLVGGSMLYMSSVTDGLTMAPAVSRERHQELLNMDNKMLYRRLQKLDPDAAAAIHKNNTPRVVRAIEVCEVLEKPKSKVMAALNELRPRGAGEQKSPYDLLIFGVEQSADVLKKRMADRLEKMIEGGWIDEVRNLLAQGYRAEDPGMKSTGYREIVEYLTELDHAGSDADIEAMQEMLKARILTKTRQYAKRQLTWWRGDRRIRWISA